MDRRSAELSYSLLDGRTDLCAPQHGPLSPASPWGSPWWGHPTLLGTHRDGGLLQWPKGSPILLGAARAARSCYRVPGLGTVPTSPQACPQPPPMPPTTPGWWHHPGPQQDPPAHPSPAILPHPSPGGVHPAPRPNPPHVTRWGPRPGGHPGCSRSPQSWCRWLSRPGLKCAAEGGTGGGKGLTSAPHPPALCPMASASGRGGWTGRG